MLKNQNSSYFTQRKRMVGLELFGRIFSSYISYTLGPMHQVGARGQVKVIFDLPVKNLQTVLTPCVKNTQNKLIHTVL